MTFDDIEARTIRLNSGKPLSFRDGERKCKALAWMLKQYFSLRTEGVEIDCGRGLTTWYQCYCADFNPPTLNREQLAAIEFAARYCREVTLGIWRDECLHLPYSAGAPLDSEEREKEVWTFTDRDRAEMCLSICRDVFGFSANLKSWANEWMVEIEHADKGNKRISTADYFRLQGACLVLADHEIRGAKRAVRKGIARGRIAELVGAPPSRPRVEFSPDLAKTHSPELGSKFFSPPKGVSQQCAPVEGLSIMKRP